MKAYIVESTNKIEPFGDHPHNCLIANKKLGEIQRDVLRKLNLELKVVPSVTLVSDPQEHIVLEDSLFFTEELVKEFLERSRAMKRSTVCALKRGLFTAHSMVTTQNVTIYPDRVEYGLRYVPPKKLRSEPVPLVINPEQFYERFPVPEHMLEGRQYHVPVTNLAIIQIDHWANLWAANMSVLLSKIASLRKASRVKKAYLILRARSMNKWKILCKTNKIGKKCDIHPTAYIEGCTIGDNVMVGAGAVVRLSIIGDSANIGSNVNIESSVVGEGCAIDSGSGLFGTVLYPGAATSASVIYVSLCGKNTFVAEGVSLADFRFDGKSVTVIKDGVPVDTKIFGLGSCLGHGVYLGAGCVVAPGRSIPNGLRITPDERRVIRSIYPDGSVPGHRRIGFFSANH
jgi:acetyltransferase-like isoleucine patch superfamily enzyme